MPTAFRDLECRVPQFGDDSRIDVIATHAVEGEVLPVNGLLVTLALGEWEFDLPSPASGTVVKWLAHTGDVLSSADTIAVVRVSDAASTAAAPAVVDESARNLPVFDDGFGTVERQPLSRVRRAGARRLAKSWPMVPQVTHIDHADVTSAQAELAHFAGREPAAVPSLLALVMRAVTDALDQHPHLASSFDETDASLLIKRYRHIGIATDTPNGLMVPVLHNVEGMSAQVITSEIRALVARSRAGRLPPASLEGSCFTISNLGSIGGEMFTPIVNPPDVAILGLARTVERVRLSAGQLAVAQMLPLCLSYDHRAIDGAQAARFVKDVRARVEDPGWIAIEFAR